jgi:HAD superfamily hydrolase (TIGR01549 family)
VTPTLDALFLDAGGVLVHPNWAWASAALARHGVEVAAVTLATAEAHAKRALDDPARFDDSSDAQRWLAYFDLVLVHAGVAPSAVTRAALDEVRAYHARQNLWEVVPAEVVPALERLRAAGLRVVVVSNANGTLAAAMARIGLAPHVDHILDSQEVGCEKPDPRIFELALARAGCHRERAAHVGDLYHVDVVGARRAGLRGVLLDAAGLYAGYDCPRVPSLSAAVDLALAGRL